MSTGTITIPVIVGLSGLNSRTTNREAVQFTPFGTPSRDVGYVTDERKISMWLWNGTGADVTLTAINATGDTEGISWTPDAPLVIEAMTSVRVNITVTVEDGPLSYEAALAFVSACLTVPEFSIIGTRAPHLSADIGYLIFPHNWEDGLDETLAWKTDVMVAHDRTEQRVQLRTLPRRSWDLRLLVSGAGRRKLETWLGMRKARYLFVPIWRDAQQLSAQVNSGESVLYIDAGGDNYADGTPMVIWTSWDNFEIHTVDGHGEGYVSVDAPFQQSWPVGTYVAPARYCLSLETRRVNRFTEDVGDYRLRVMANDDRWSPSGAEPETYQSLPVCPFVPSWEDGDENYDNKWVSLDNETGVIEFDVQSEEPVMSREARFLVIGRDNINTFMAFLADRAGRLSPFWLTANDRGFELAEPAAADATEIIIEPISYEYALADSDARDHIEMVTTDGTVIRRQIMAVQTLPDGNEQLTLSSALLVDISSATLDRCAWLELVRFDSDEIGLHWVTPECVEVTVPIVVLP